MTMSVAVAGFRLLSTSGWWPRPAQSAAFRAEQCRLADSLRQKLVEDPHDERVVTLVIEALQTLMEIWVMREHVVFKCELNPIGQHPSPGRNLMYGATERTDRAEPVGFVVSRIDRAAIGSSSKLTT
jgi:hypothetical protein